MKKLTNLKIELESLKSNMWIDRQKSELNGLCDNYIDCFKKMVEIETRIQEIFNAKYEDLGIIQNVLKELETRIQEIFNAKYEDSGIIQNVLKELEKSNQYSFDETGEIIRWVRFPFSEFEGETEYLECYFADHGVYCDFKNDCLYELDGCGNYILDHEDGDVVECETGEIIIFERDYIVDGERDFNRLHELLELHREKTGVYGSLFETDGCGFIQLMKGV